MCSMGGCSILGVESRLHGCNLVVFLLLIGAAGNFIRTRACRHVEVLPVIQAK